MGGRIQDGPATGRVGIHTVADLARADPAELAEHFGPTTGPWLVQLGRGGGSTQVDAQPRIARSRSRETTFPEDLTDRTAIVDRLRDLARELAREVVAEGRPVRRVAVKIRYPSFTTPTRIMHPAGGNGGRRGYRKRRARARWRASISSGACDCSGYGSNSIVPDLGAAQAASRRSDWNGLVLMSVPATRFG